MICSDWGDALDGRLKAKLQRGAVMMRAATTKGTVPATTPPGTTWEGKSGQLGCRGCHVARLPDESVDVTREMGLQLDDSPPAWRISWKFPRWSPSEVTPPAWGGPSSLDDLRKTAEYRRHNGKVPNSPAVNRTTTSASESRQRSPAPSGIPCIGHLACRSRSELTVPGQCDIVRRFVGWTVPTAAHDHICEA